MLTIPLHDQNLEHKRSLESLNSKIIKSKRVVVISGAGISCSCGIPDFRSSDGLYNLVKEKYNSQVIKGQDLFDAHLFRNPSTTSLFYSFISQLKLASDNAQPSLTHKFIKTLESKGKLLHSYTQNVDGLEERVGIEKLINLHGSLNEVRCASCSYVQEMSRDYLDIFSNGRSPSCPQCELRANERSSRGKRALGVGCLRPGIVLYNENHWSGDAIANAQSADNKKKPDLLIVMGTSLKVHGLKSLVKSFARNIHANNESIQSGSRKQPGSVVFVNATPAAGKEWSGDLDYFVHGTTDEFVQRLTDQWKTVKPSDWQIQTKITDAHKVTKNNVNVANKKSSNDDNKNINEASNNLKKQQISSKSSKPMLESNSHVTSKKRLKDSNNSCNDIKRSISSNQIVNMDVSILKKNKSEDLSLNFDIKIQGGSDTEVEEDDNVNLNKTNLNCINNVRRCTRTIKAH